MGGRVIDEIYIGEVRISRLFSVDLSAFHGLWKGELIYSLIVHMHGGRDLGSIPRLSSLQLNLKLG
jgi:hypothetical protein